MADAQILEASGSGQTPNSTTWVDVAEIAAGSFTANAKYLILAFAQAQHASSMNETRFRLVHGETPTEFTDAYDAEEMVANTSHVTVGWMAMFTQPSTTERIRIQASSSSTTTVTVEYGHILAINLDDIGTEDTDYRWNEHTTDQTMSSGGVTGATETWTPNGTDKYLYIGQASWVPGSTNGQNRILLLKDTGTLVEISEEGEDTTNEQRNRLLVYAETPTNASHTIDIVGFSETGSFGTLLSSRLFILNLSRFAQADFDTDAGTTALTEGAGWINLATLSVTPDATGDFVLLGGMIQDYNAAAGSQPEGRMQVNPDGGGLVSRPAYGDDGAGIDTWDGTDQRSLVLFDLVSLTSGASRTINLDGQMGNTGVADPQVFARTLVYFSKALASGASTVTPALLTVTVTPTAPSGIHQVVAAPALLTVTVTPTAPEVEQSVAPALLTVTVTPEAPAGVHQSVTPGLVTVTVTPETPVVVNAGGPQTVTPGLITVTVTPEAPEVEQSVQPGLLTVTITPEAPSAVHQSVAPALLTVTVTPTAPAGLHQSLTPGLLTVTVTPTAPEIDQSLTPALLTVTVTPTAPEGIHQAVAPALLTVALTPTAPTVSQAAGGQIVEPGLLSVTITPTAPTGVKQAVAPALLSVTITPTAPNLVLGLSPSAGQPVVEYVIELLTSGSTFGPNVVQGEVWDARNIGWSRYDRVPGKAFFTLPQSSPHLSKIVPLTTHVRIWRLSPGLTTLVYVGFVVDADETGDDVVVTCFDYLALLSISRSGYRVLYPAKLVGTEIVSPEWTLAKNATSSPLGFVATGTIEDPLGTDGTTPIKTNNQFGLLDQMRLQLFYDLSEMGRANTINHVTYEITRSTTPTFHFRKNAGSTVGLGLILNGNVTDFRHLPNWTGYRNNLATIGVTTGGGATEVVVNDATEAAARGLRQDVFTIKTLLGIVGAATEADQQKAVAERMLKEATTLQPTILLRLRPNSLDFFNGWDINDMPQVEIGGGMSTIATRWRLLGVRALFDEEGEHPGVLVSPRLT